MSKESIAKNYIYNLMYQVIVIILPLITTPYLTRVLGAESLGVFSYTVSIVTYFILFGSMGVAMYAKREIAYVQQDKEKRSKVFWEVWLLRTITLLISMIVFYFIFASKGEYSVYYKILILEIIANILDISAFFQGMEEFKKIIKRNLITKIISIVSIFIFIKDSTNLNIYLVIYVLSTFIGNISLWFYLPKYIQKVPLKLLEIKKHIKPTIVLFIPQIATQIYVLLDKTMIGTLVEDKAEVAYYGQVQRMVKIILTLATAIGPVMLPRIANEFASGELKKIKSKIVNSFNFIYFLSVPLMFGTILVAKDFIPWFLGEGFEKSIYITYAISPIILFIGLSNVIGHQYLIPTKKQKHYTLSVTAGAIVNLILNFIFIPKFLSMGAAIGTIIAEAVVTIVQFYCIRKDFNIKEILKMSIKYFCVGILMSIIILSINKLYLYNISVAVRIGTDILCGAIVYITVLLILKDEFTIKVINRILKFKKEKNII